MPREQGKYMQQTDNPADGSSHLTSAQTFPVRADSLRIGRILHWVNSSVLTEACFCTRQGLRTFYYDLYVLKMTSLNIHKTKLTIMNRSFYPE